MLPVSNDHIIADDRCLCSSQSIYRSESSWPEVYCMTHAFSDPSAGGGLWCTHALSAEGCSSVARALAWVLLPGYSHLCPISRPDTGLLQRILSISHINNGVSFWTNWKITYEMHYYNIEANALEFLENQIFFFIYFYIFWLTLQRLITLWYVASYLNVSLNIFMRHQGIMSSVFSEVWRECFRKSWRHVSSLLMEVLERMLLNH